MNFQSEVIGAYWQQETGEWLIKIKQTQADGSTKLFDERCHLLLYGAGALNNYKWPDIEGIEKFKGRVIWLPFLSSSSHHSPQVDRPHRQMAEGVPGTAVEERPSSRDRVRLFLHSDSAWHAAVRKAHRHFCTNR